MLARVRPQSSRPELQRDSAAQRAGSHTRIYLAEIFQRAGARRHRGVQRGPEFNAEELNQLKEPFTPGSNRVSGPGHGLDLALVDAIATSHHGQLDLAPRPGGGVVARLRIPCGLPVSLRQTPRQAAG
ncbi:ATP-binding protein [Corynebacterium appendicis]|uniref:ATP-binding protein n=1 Tax=Corynebacterium appendicis TaxID=163202 RepID=UPI0035CD2DC7